MFTLSHALAATAAVPNTANCYQTGCAEGELCVQNTDPSRATCFAVPDPPPNCMAPCLWQARRKCLPVRNSCAEEIVPTGGFNDVRTVCDASSGWAVREARSDAVPLQTSYRKSAVTCFEMKLNFNNGRIDVTYSNGTDPIAVSALSFPNPNTQLVHCGPHTSTDGLDPSLAYAENTSSPECTAWQRTYLDPINCRTTAPGSCAGL
jgi:hypothetical protein